MLTLPRSPFNYMCWAPTVHQAQHWTFSYVEFSLRNSFAMLELFICPLQGETEIPSGYILLTLAVLASCGCYNKYHKLMTIKHQTFVLSRFWRADVWNQDIGGAMLPLEALWEILFLASTSFWWSPTFLGLRPHHSNICLLIFCLCQISLCFSLIRTLVIGFRIHPDNPNDLGISKFLT